MTKLNIKLMSFLHSRIGDRVIEDVTDNKVGDMITSVTVSIGGGTVFYLGSEFGGLGKYILFYYGSDTRRRIMLVDIINFLISVSEQEATYRRKLDECLSIMEDSESIKLAADKLIRVKGAIPSLIEVVQHSTTSSEELVRNVNDLLTNIGKNYFYGSGLLIRNLISLLNGMDGNLQPDAESPLGKSARIWESLEDPTIDKYSSFVAGAKWAFGFLKRSDRNMI